MLGFDIGIGGTQNIQFIAKTLALKMSDAFTNCGVPLPQNLGEAKNNTVPESLRRKCSPPYTLMSA
jgi:hypothetical protein